MYFLIMITKLPQLGEEREAPNHMRRREFCPCLFHFTCFFRKLFPVSFRHVGRKFCPLKTSRLVCANTRHLFASFMLESWCLPMACGDHPEGDGIGRLLSGRTKAGRCSVQVSKTEENLTGSKKALKRRSLQRTPRRVLSRLVRSVRK